MTEHPFDDLSDLDDTPIAAKSGWPYIIGGVVAIATLPLGVLVGGYAMFLAMAITLAGVGLLVVGIIRAARTPQAPRSFGPAPTAYTSDGQPIYPVVGYTPDGTPVTADRAVGYINARTNTMAITALVLGLIFPLAAIPVGHISLGQINRTGEQGRGLAIAGLVLGYVTLAVWVIVGAYLVLSSM